MPEASQKQAQPGQPDRTVLPRLLHFFAGECRCDRVGADPRPLHGVEQVVSIDVHATRGGIDR